MGFQSDMYAAEAGFTAARETYENVFRWGQTGLGVIVGVKISGAARDAGNTITTNLRSGLLLGPIGASGLMTNYSPTATDGSDVVAGVLIPDIKAVDNDGTNVNRIGWMLAAGPVQGAKLINLDYVARAQMRSRFLFDDDYGNRQSYVGWQREIAKAASYTVVAADAGTLFTTTGASGAIVFTLPAILPGLGPFEFLDTVDQNMTVTSAEGSNIVILNNLVASSIAFTTSSQKIGSRVRLVANDAGTKWLVEFMTAAAATTTTTQEWISETAKTADYTVLAADINKLFTTTGSSGNVNFTLPTLAANLGPFFFLNTVDFNMTVTSAAGDDIVTFNDAAADSLAFSTSSQKIGGFLRVQANAAAAKWYAQNLSPGNTITVAT